MESYVFAPLVTHCINYALEVGFVPTIGTARKGVCNGAAYHNSEYTVDLFITDVAMCAFKIIGYRQSEPEVSQPYTVCLKNPSFAKFCLELDNMMLLNEDFSEKPQE